MRVEPLRGGDLRIGVIHFGPHRGAPSLREGGLAFTFQSPRCLRIFSTCPPLPLKPYQELDPSFHFPRFATDSCHEEARQAGDLDILNQVQDKFLGTLRDQPSPIKSGTGSDLLDQSGPVFSVLLKSFSCSETGYQRSRPPPPRPPPRPPPKPPPDRPPERGLFSCASFTLMVLPSRLVPSILEIADLASSS